jgi:ATP-binding cassette, subfamily G (WHITE), member 2, PDR
MAENHEKWQPASGLKISSEADIELGALAHTVTALSQGSHDYEKELEDDDNPFLRVLNPRLDPLSGRFDSVLWTKTILQLQSNDPDDFPRYTAAVSFSNLNVYGYGRPTDYQKTVGNYPLAIAGFARNLLGRKGQKVDIIRNFEGYVSRAVYVLQN